MSGARYPAWWDDLQKRLVASGAMEEGGLDKFTIAMTQADYAELLERQARIVEITFPGGSLDALRLAGLGSIRIGGIPVVVSPHAVPGHPAVVPA